VSTLAAPVDAGRQAAARHAWREVYDGFTDAESHELTPEEPVEVVSVKLR